MTEWQDIASAPKDGSVIRARRIHEGERVWEGEASWRLHTFPSFINGIHGIEPAHQFEGWMYVNEDKKVPTPTHWQPA